MTGKIHSLRRGYITWCGRNINRYVKMDCSTPDRPATCKVCIRRREMTIGNAESFSAIAKATEEA